MNSPVPQQSPLGRLKDDPRALCAAEALVAHLCGRTDDLAREIARFSREDGERLKSALEKWFKNPRTEAVGQQAATLRGKEELLRRPELSKWLTDWLPSFCSTCESFNRAPIQ